MAEGFTDIPLAVPDSITTECDPCKFEGTEAQGVAFCTVCQDNLCVDCSRSHKKSKNSRCHEIVEPGENSTRENPGVDISSLDLCELHQYQISKFCKMHDALLCCECLAVDHRKCQDVLEIQNICETEAGPQQVSTHVSELVSLVDVLDALEEQQDTGERELLQQQEICLGQIDKLRSAVNSRLDKLAAEIRQEVGAILEKEVCKFSSRKTTLQFTKKTLKLSAEKVKKANETDRCRTFIAMKKASIQKVLGVIKDIQHEAMDVQIRFEPNSLLRNLIGNLQNLGRLRIEKKRPHTIPKANKVTRVVETIGPSNSESPTIILPDDLKNKRLEKAAEYSVREGDDTEQCYITGSQFLLNDDLLLCDHKNRKLKLLDKTFTVKTSVKFGDQPWDVALISDKVAAVTFPAIKTIRFLSVDGTLIRHQGDMKDIVTELKCWGIVYQNRYLFVTCHNEQNRDSQILVKNMQHGLMGVIPRTNQFYLPYYIAVDRELNIYVADAGTHSITCMSTFSSKALKRFNKNLNRLHGLLVDNQQNVYVCGGMSGTIEIISPVSENCKTLVSADEGFTLPMTLAIRHTDKITVVGMLGDSIHCFRFVGEGFFSKWRAFSSKR